MFLCLGVLALFSLPSRSTVSPEGAPQASPAQASPAEATTAYVLPLDLGPGWQTTVTLTNLTPGTLQVSFMAYDHAGGPLGDILASSSLQAEETQEMDAATGLPPGSATLQLDSPGQLVGVATLQSVDGKKSEMLPAMQEAAPQLDFPALLHGDHNEKAITLLNSDAAPAHLEVIALDHNGVELQRAFLPPLSPLASHTVAVKDLFSAEDLPQLATVRIRADQGIVGLQLVDPPDGDLVGLPALTTTSQQWWFPMATSGGGLELWTTVGLFNPGEGTTAVTVEAFDAADQSLGRIDQAALLPGATHWVRTANLDGVIPAHTAALKVTADQPVSGYAVVGVNGGMGVTATRGMPAEDEATVGLELTGSIDGRTLTVAPMVRMADGGIRSTAGTLEAGHWNERLIKNLAGHAAGNVGQREGIKAREILGTEGQTQGVPAAKAPVQAAPASNCYYYPVEQVDPVPQLLTGAMITPDVDVLSTGGRNVAGAAADGVAKLVIRIKSNVGTRSIIFSLDPADGAVGTTGKVTEDGSLSTIEAQTVPSNKVTVQTVETARGRMAFAIYNAPLDFVRSGTSDNTSVTRDIVFSYRIDDRDRTTCKAQIRIARPPVFLVHGIWSNSLATWANFSPLVRNGAAADPRFSVKYGNYSLVSAGPISESATMVGNLLQGEIFNYKTEKNIAAVQADVVAHSLGGLVTRALAAPAHLRHRFIRADNFNKGDIHKFITIGSPHLGSRMASQIESAMRQGGSPLLSFIEDAFEAFMGINRPLTSGAVWDVNPISQFSTFMSRLSTENLLPSHHIVGRADPTDKANNHVWEDIVRWVITGCPPTFLPGKIGFGGKLCDLFTDRGFTLIYGNQDHDIFIEESSQKDGGFVFGRDASVFSSLVHSDSFKGQVRGRTSLAETKSRIVGDWVVALLNNPVKSIFFKQPAAQGDARFAQTSDTRFREAEITGLGEGTLPRPEGSLVIADAGPSLATGGGIRITVPSDGATVSPGERIRVEVEPVGGVAVNYVFVSIAGDMQFDDSAPFIVDLQVPADFVGSRTIVALGGDLDGNAFVDKIAVNVAAPAVLQSLRTLEPNIEFADTGIKKQIFVLGTFSDGITRDITLDSRTSYTSSNSSIATVSQGLVESVSRGIATITVRNAGKSVSVIVTVDSSNEIPMTELVKDINPGSGHSYPDYLTNVNGTLFFVANDGTSGGELWKSNGTAAGTVLVKDINPGSGDSQPRWLTNVNGTLFFVANDGTNGRELWKSNGTAAGTVLVKDINLGSGHSSPTSLTNVNGTLFFVANNGTTGVELWKSDGTAAGTVLVKDINPGSDFQPGWLTNVNGTLFFTASDGVRGIELWKSNGTAAGTVLVKDINPGSGHSSPTSLTNVNGTLFFSANDGVHGIELWKSDGTAAGTVLVKDINPGSGPSSPTSLTNVNGTLFFGANNGVTGSELWKSDGTAAGTVLVTDINPGSGPSNPSVLTNVNGTLFFTASDGVRGIELWKSNGTAAGTVLVKDINPGPGDALHSPTLQLTNVNGTLFFRANDGATGFELWKSDGTAAGTVLVKDINPGRSDSFPIYLTNVNGTLFFSADDGTNGKELWKVGSN
jgi:ELWxxDGT repeat protein